MTCKISCAAKGLCIVLFCLLAFYETKAQLNDPTIRAKARASEFAAKFVRKDYAGATSFFTPHVAEQITVQKMSELFPSLEKAMGPFGRFSDTVYTEKQDSFVVTYTPAYFQRGTLDMQLVFDHDLLIAGIFFKPHVERQLYAPKATVLAGIVEKNIAVNSGSYSLPGKFVAPEGKGPFPVIILVAGSGPTDMDGTTGPNKPLRDLAYGLAQQGIASIRYDKRALHIRSADEVKTVQQEVVDDVLAAISFAAALPEVDKNNIYVLGHSLGGMLAPLIASQSKGLAGIILMAAPARSLPEMVMEQAVYLKENSGDAQTRPYDDLYNTAQAMRTKEGIEKYPSEMILGAPKSYWLQLLEYDQLATAASLDIPILVLQAGRDYQVTKDDYKLWKKALKKNKADFKEYKSLNHLFLPGKGTSLPAEYQTRGHIPAEVTEDIAEWVKGEF